MNTKDMIRDKIWTRLTEEKLGRFPFPLYHRIPNFKGAERAAAHIMQLEIYRQAKVIKVNPDAPQLPLRTQILKDGKTLLVPTPRLKAGFIQVKPEWVPPGEERKAASLSHIKDYGKEIPLTAIPKIDLMVMGSVAVHTDGRRIGKGEGYADREYAILRELGQPDLPVITTVHSRQVVEEDIPRDSFDVAVDLIATEQGIIHTQSPYERPSGIDWTRVTQEEREEMPILQELWDQKYR